MTLTKRSRERGFSLVEVLVATAVLVTVMVIVMQIFDASRKSFKLGENVSEQQQGVRIAFDTVSADLRAIGFNSNPDGDRARPDEQIEAALDTAIVIRADFDAEDPTTSVTPEEDLDGGAFLTVSTGNDEIVAYVLAKADGSSSDTLTFQADVKDVPRDGVIETVSVPNVALVQDDPPYTLYRISLNNDESTWGSSDFITRAPLVENIRSLTFRYYDAAGNQINSTFNLASTADDIGGSDVPAVKTQRSAIQRIGLGLEGLTREPNLGWVDPDDTNPVTQSYPKFQLAANVTPRNVGKVGKKDLRADVTPPSKPGTPTLYPGHCGGFFVTWAANPPEDQVTSYRIQYGTSSGSPTGVRNVGSSGAYLGALEDNTTYYVTIRALDDSGNVSVASNETSQLTTNINTPELPLNLAATTDLEGDVDVTWDAVTENTGATAGDPASPLIRDLAGYRVYRGSGSNFPASASNLLIGEKKVTTPILRDGTGVACRDYYYRVTAVDACGVESTATDAVLGKFITTILPKPPANVQAFYYGGGNVRVTWDEVIQNVNDKPVAIEDYKIYRSALVPSSTDPLSIEYTFYGVSPGTGNTEFIDSSPLPSMPDYTSYYRVSAVDDCPNESELSNPDTPDCEFTGTVQFVSPANGSDVAGGVPVQVTVVDGTDTYTEMILELYHQTNGTRKTVVISGPGPVWSYGWLANPPGPYTLTATVKNDQGCAAYASIEVNAGDDVGCCLTPLSSVMACSSGKQACKHVSYDMTNECLADVAIKGMGIYWVDEVGNAPELELLKLDGVDVWVPALPVTSPAATVFGSPPIVGVERDSMYPFSTNLVFSTATSLQDGFGNYVQDTMTTGLSFYLLDSDGLPTEITGSCSFSFIVQQHQ